MTKTDWEWPTGILCLIIGSVIFVHYQPHSSVEMAAWVQAVGAVIAVAVAIGVSRKQYNDSKALHAERDRQEVRAFVQAIRDEISAIWEGYCLQAHPALVGLPAGQLLNLYFPASADSLTIYNNNSSVVGKVHDAELRRLIVGGYARAKGMILSFDMNNRMLNELETLTMSYQQSDRAEVLAGKSFRLVAYAGILKQRDADLTSYVEAFLIRADILLRTESPI